MTVHLENGRRNILVAYNIITLTHTHTQTHNNESGYPTLVDKVLRYLYYAIYSMHIWFISGTIL